ncbi:biotin-dependent carboxyltransferase family protein [Salinicola corii]|uniref:Biotin-dependent carboxyltransferase family protein n=1 Tax=Salinicola corii TaxID=2606937 RepID=A0A640WDU4_9GAMM|nr:biotin-dependent carboxyltransferase family protein [Salinicola corii]KAA0018138.1 biotin-dependent carboxyltransferase family protein [Salinicola corii]
MSDDRDNTDVAFRVASPGMMTTLQDGGRHGQGHLGVPPSGALDTMSLGLANALVGNVSEDALQAFGALEITLMGPRLRLVGGDCVVAITGDAEITVNDRPVETFRALALREGDELQIHRVLSGARAYLAVGGGFAATPFLGSVSTLARAGVGGFDGRALRAGDRLPLRNAARGQECAGRVGEPHLPQREKRPIRVGLGPQSDFFSRAKIARFFSAEWTISTLADRMGYRLTGPVLASARGHNIVSDALMTGSVQIPGDGQPIIAMNDRGTTGGYPKIATVIRADMARLGQMKPGDRLRFEAIDPAHAEHLWRGRQEAFRAYLARLAI